MASNVGKLSDIPVDFGIQYLKAGVSLRRKKKARAFISGCFIEKFKIWLEKKNTVTLYGEVYPSVRKSDSRHVVNIQIDRDDRSIKLAHCKFQQG